jgi:hypothetical protein
VKESLLPAVQPAVATAPEPARLASPAEQEMVALQAVL